MRSSDRVHAVLRQEILDGVLPPGAALGEIEQSERLGVSRTPLREALGRLMAERLVSPGAGRSVVVTEVSAADVRALFEARVALEVQAVRLAAQRRDPAPFELLRAQFLAVDRLIDTDDAAHHEYYDLAGRLDAAVDGAAANPYLTGPLQTVRTHIARVRRLSNDNPDRMRQAAREHLMIVEAILDGADDIAAHAMQVHLHRSLAAIVTSLGSLGDHASLGGHGSLGHPASLGDHAPPDRRRTA